MRHGRGRDPQLAGRAGGATPRTDIAGPDPEIQFTDGGIPAGTHAPTAAHAPGAPHAAVEHRLCVPQPHPPACAICTSPPVPSP